VAGLITSLVSPDLAETYSPLTKFLSSRTDTCDSSSSNCAVDAILVTNIGPICNILLSNQSQYRETGADSFAECRFDCQTRIMSRVMRTKSSQLDDVSKAIVEQLQLDGRRSYAEIGKKVGLSEAAVRQRVQKLTDSGVMQVVAVTDPMQLGFYRQAMIGVRCGGDTREIAEAMAEMPEVDYVVMTAGSFDILVEVVCENDDDLIALLNSKIRTLPGVTSTETFVYLKVAKQVYNWGTR
jgi:Lrp/AsnC family transcriptional regulator for asnA, asnC and gidA